MIELILLVSVLAPGGVVKQWKDRMFQANGLRLENRYREAEAAYADALEWAEKLGPDSLPLALTLNNAGSCYQVLGRFVDAERAFTRSLGIYERRHGVASHMAVEVATNLSGVYLETGRVSKAESLARRFIRVSDRLSPEDRANIEAVLGSVLLSGHKLDEAESMFRQALTCFEHGTSQKAREQTVITLSHLALIFQRTRRLPEARAYSERARRLLGALPDPPVVLSIKTLANAATVSAVSGSPEDAESLFRSVISLCERGLGRDHYLLGKVLSNYSEFLRRANRKKEAKVLAIRAKRILDSSTRDNLMGHTVDVGAFR